MDKFKVGDKVVVNERGAFVWGNSVTLGQVFTVIDIKYNDYDYTCVDYKWNGGHCGDDFAPEELLSRDHPNSYWGFYKDQLDLYLDVSNLKEEDLW